MVSEGRKVLKESAWHVDCQRGGERGWNTKVIERVIRDEDREAEGAGGCSGQLWVTVDISGLGLSLKEGCGWVTKGVGGHSGGENSLSLCS